MPNSDDSKTTKSYNPSLRVDLPQPFSGDGTEDFGQWARRLEVAVNASSEFANAHLCDILPARLAGAAFNYWDSLTDAIKGDYSAVKEKLKVIFGKRLFITTFQSHIGARPRVTGEPLEVYAAELSNLVEEAFPTYGKNAREGECFRRFISGIDPYLQLRVHELGATTFKQAVEFAGRVERAHQASNISTPPPTLQPNILIPPLIPSTQPTMAQANVPAESVQSINEDTFTQLQRTVDSLVEKMEAMETKLTRGSTDEYYRRNRSPMYSSQGPNRAQSPSSPRRSRNWSNSRGRYYSPSPTRRGYQSDSRSWERRSRYSPQRSPRNEEPRYFSADSRYREERSQRFSPQRTPNNDELRYNPIDSKYQIERNQQWSPRRSPNRHERDASQYRHDRNDNYYYKSRGSPKKYVHFQESGNYN